VYLKRKEEEEEERIDKIKNKKILKKFKLIKYEVF